MMFLVARVSLTVPIERIEDDCTFAVLSLPVEKESEAEACSLAGDAAEEA